MSNSPALDTVLAYHRAWSAHDFEHAMTYVADDIVCDAPAGRVEGADAFREFFGPFVQIMREARMLAAFGDDETALIMYDTVTIPVASAPGAERITVRDGKITHIQIIFDRAPFEAAHAAAEAS
ncbi:SnoaL-like protein [Herbihabitans rhizosphaerae]|uniref:SnoaL-like protein n=1 Tax=Herbihabitans rhizosphaerae TaxID=1872711 RepID=A0A4Q7KPQ4_9PSEU|nr:nuclear transport factor 2 family protein [Herbihabitans rhizosphaerae]RZS37671.1 SnoaL-like protein [Herbihabitans rhizosphaerae]